MKITVFNSSPHSERGNTQVMVEAFLEGTRQAGAETEEVFLAKKTIKHCLGCFTCWMRTPGLCVIEDDMAELRTKYMSSDIVVLAGPLYCDNINGIMKDFMDRSIPLFDPRIQTLPEDDPKRQEEVKRFPKIVIMMNCGDAGNENFDGVKVIFKRWSRYPETRIIAEIYRDEGEILAKTPLVLRLAVWGYKDLLKKAGREIVDNQRISEKTMSELEKPIIPIDQYQKGAKEFWDKSLPKDKRQ